jgi:hypothetical protein
MSRLYKVLAAVVLSRLLGSAVLCLPVAGREVKLVICPQKLPAESGKYPLLPAQESLVDGDAVGLYEKAIKALPSKDTDEQMYEWLNMPIDQLPVEQVEQTLRQYVESLKYAFRATRCRQCRWPAGEPGDRVMGHQGYRRLALATALWATLEIARQGYEEAILAVQTGFAMARHLGQAPALLLRQRGIGIGVIMCCVVEELVQVEGSPNLYTALASLPKPFVDVEKTGEMEKKAIDETRGLVKRLDSHLAALQCVEAIRSYAASHNGQLPGTLAEIIEVAVPIDPLNGELFRYMRTGPTVVLESAVPDGGTEAMRTRYVITVKN